MSDYTKLTDFASKDALPSGNANKIVKGTEIDDEFDAIETAIGTKADTNSPTLTGLPLAPTATAGTSTTQIATTSFVATAISNDAVTSTEFVNAVYPVGSIYINATNSSNPNTLLGHGTWVAFGAGRVPVGFDSSDSDFNSAEETGGAKTHTLTSSQMPSHTHTFTDYTYQENGGSGPGGTGQGSASTDNDNRATRGVSNTTNATGSGAAHNNLQPYITVYMWKRTA